MTGLFYWQKCCLGYKGDTEPCYSPCNHCARMAEVMMQEFATLRTQWLGMKDEIRLLRDAAKQVCDFDWSENDDDAVAAINRLRSYLPTGVQT